MTDGNEMKILIIYIFLLVSPLIRVRNKMIYVANGSSAQLECEVSS